MTKKGDDCIWMIILTVMTVTGDYCTETAVNKCKHSPKIAKTAKHWFPHLQASSKARRKPWPSTGTGTVPIGMDTCGGEVENLHRRSLQKEG